MKAIFGVPLAVLCSIASAQSPDVTIRLDARLNYLSPNGGPPTQRLYDTLGRPSLLKIEFMLEPGLRAFVGQRFQKIRGDGDPDLLDEYYIEDAGIWRVGKQILPFGAGAFLRETCLAARGDLDLPLEGSTLSAAIVDSGNRRQRGVVGRIALYRGLFGLSFARGTDLGICASSFALFRPVEQSAGIGGGYRQLIGADLTRTWGDWSIRFEYVNLNGSRSGRSPNGGAFDVNANYAARRDFGFNVGWTRSPLGDDFYRVGASLKATRNVTLEPMVRFKGSTSYDFSLCARIRL